MSRTPLQFDYGSRSNSSPIPFSEPPHYSNYAGYFAPLLAPHTKFPFVKGFVPNSCLSATAAVPYSATPSSVATSKIGPSQSSLQRNAQDLQNRELATAVSLLKSTIAQYFNVYEEGLHLKVSRNGKIENAWPSPNGDRKSVV